jgi:uncharacterized membrane protein
VPTAGFLIFVPREKIVPLDMSPEDAAKLLLSGGLVAPDHLPVTLPATEEVAAKRGKVLSRP